MHPSFNHCCSYQHVSGRVGREGLRGHAITLMSADVEHERYVTMLQRLGLRPLRESALDT